MDMEKSLDDAARATAELRVILADLIEDGTIDFMSPGSTGELHGEHHPKIGIHLNIDRATFRERREELLAIVRPAKDKGIEVVFFHT